MQFGFLLADGSNGPFRFEVQFMRAIRDFNREDFASGAMQSIEANVKEQKVLLEEAKAVTARNSAELKEYYRQQKERAKLQ